MLKLDELREDLQVSGLAPSGPAVIVAVQGAVQDAVSMFYKNTEGRPSEQMLSGADEARLDVAPRVGISPSTPMAATSSWPLNAINVLAISKLDVLDSVETIKVCIAYEYRGKRRELAPLDAEGWAECKTVYLEFLGWDRPTSGFREWNKLPPAPRDYQRAIEELSQCFLTLVATGADRDDTIVLEDPFA